MPARTHFLDHEIAYLTSQSLGRIATVDSYGRPRLVPTGFAVNTDDGTVHLGGRDFATTRRVHDIRSNPHVMLVVDDVADPVTWSARGVAIRGIAQLHDADASSVLPPFLANGAWMSITPTAIRSWGLEEARS